MEDRKTATRHKFQKSYPHENYAHAHYEVAEPRKPGTKICINHYQNQQECRAENKTNQEQAHVIVKLRWTKISQFKYASQQPEQGNLRHKNTKNQSHQF